MKNKRGSILNQVTIQIILIVFVLGMFLMVTAGKVNGRGVRQQVLEKQTALLIDAADSGMSFEISKLNRNGVVSSVEVRDSSVFIVVDGLGSLKGYPYFSKYDVLVLEEGDKFVVTINDK